jgi:hypothetical protein
MVRGFARRLVYLLIAALLVAQQGSVLHALAHGVDAIKTAGTLSDRPDQRNPLAERHCNLCLTYAQLAAAAPPDAPTLPAAAIEHVAPLSSHLSAGAFSARAYHSRAPPFAV